MNGQWSVNHFLCGSSVRVSPMEYKQKYHQIMVSPKIDISYQAIKTSPSRVAAELFLEPGKHGPTLTMKPIGVALCWVCIFKVVKSVPFRLEWPEHSVSFKKPAQNGVVFISVSIPVRSGNSGQIPARTFRFRSGLKILFFFFF